MNTQSISKKGVAYRRQFKALRGVDFSSDPSEVSRSHFTLLENMWCDPMTLDGVATETFPGYRTFARFGAPIHAIFRHRVAGEDYLVVHAGEKLYRFPERLRNFEATLAALSPLSVTVANVPGCAFSYGEQLCLLIGGEYLMVGTDGSIRTLTDDPTLAYVPITYHNGELFEQRNLLTDKVRLVFSADGPYEEIVKEEGLLFSVISEGAKTCSVRISEKYRGAGRIEVPQTVIIGSESYTVTVVAAHGFENMTGLCAITLPPTITFIGSYAFLGDSALVTANLPNTLQTIGIEAFYGCFSLEGITLGKELNRIYRDAFGYCLSLKEVRYRGTASDYAAITMDGANTLREMSVTVSYENDIPFEITAGLYRYPLLEPCTAIQEVLLGDTPLETNFTPIGDAFVHYGTLEKEGLITHLEISTTDKTALIGKMLTVKAAVTPMCFSLPVGTAPFSEEGRHALCGCTAVVKYDGRVFFTGNPHFPNTVFYSTLDDTGVNNPFYIGCLNYFNDGTGAVPNRGFIVTGGMLAVLKADTGGEGEIFLHRPADTESNLVPRIYPVVASTPGTGLAGSTVRYSDEALFLGKEGLFALARCENDSERVLSPRSSAVNQRLLKEITADAQMAVFEGLLYLLCEGNVYIADAKRRTTYAGGGREYEWYFLTGIGSYKGDHPVYRYTSFLPESASELALSVHPDVGEIATGDIYSATLKDGIKIYYEKSNEGSFPVDTDGERTGGVFSPACRLCATDEALYFGTPDGAIGCFNTDKRGMLLYRPVQSELYISIGVGKYLPLNAGIYKLFSEDMVQKETVYRKEGTSYVEAGERSIYLDGGLAVLAEPLGERNETRRVHRYYYSFAGHAFTAFCVFAMDDGDLPHLAKDTIPHTAALKLKSPEGSRVSVFVRTDRHTFQPVEEISSTNADAGDTDFSAFSFYTDDFAAVPLREKERGWWFKQYLLKCSGFRTPFGIFSLSYAFSPSGRIKS